MARPPGPNHEAPAAAAAPRDPPLPWLAADVEARRGRGGLGKALVAGMIVLALGGGAAWYGLRLHRPATLAADGEIIRAPSGPYKVRPADPGGTLAQGTGDTSYAVAEGRPAGPMHLAGGADVTGTAGGPSDAPAAGAAVQLGAFASADDAEAQWPKLVQRYPELASLPHRVVASRADLGVVFGLRALVTDTAAATDLCTTLRAGGLACRVKG